KWLPGELRNKLKQRLSSRIWKIEDDAEIETNSWRELLRLSINSLGINSVFGWGPSGPIDWVYRSLDSLVASKDLNG
ncbi:MAG: hypothetical protein GTO02_14130, partial [Candidatus Dadabacteria bacterium]|nr:hypothetical protein [Candidatus Dadabacteria bacterium]